MQRNYNQRFCFLSALFLATSILGASVAVSEVKKASVLSRSNIAAPNAVGGLDISADGSKVLFQEKNKQGVVELKLFNTQTKTVSVVATDIRLSLTDENPPMMDDNGRFITYTLKSTNESFIYDVLLNTYVNLNAKAGIQGTQNHASSPFLIDNGTYALLFISIDCDHFIGTYTTGTSEFTLAKVVDGNMHQCQSFSPVGEYLGTFTAARAGGCIELYYGASGGRTATSYAFKIDPGSVLDITQRCDVSSTGSSTGNFGTPIVDAAPRSLSIQVDKSTLIKGRYTRRRTIKDYLGRAITKVTTASGAPLKIGVAGMFRSDSKNFDQASSSGGWAFSQDGALSTFLVNYDPQKTSEVPAKIYTDTVWIVRYNSTNRKLEIVDTVAQTKNSLSLISATGPVISSSGNAIAYTYARAGKSWIRLTRLK